MSWRCSMQYVSSALHSYWSITDTKPRKVKTEHGKDSNLWLLVILSVIVVTLCIVVVPMLLLSLPSPIHTTLFTLEPVLFPCPEHSYNWYLTLNYTHSSLPSQALLLFSNVVSFFSPVVVRLSECALMQLFSLKKKAIYIMRHKWMFSVICFIISQQ